MNGWRVTFYDGAFSCQSYIDYICILGRMKCSSSGKFKIHETMGRNANDTREATLIALLLE